MGVAELGEAIPPWGALGDTTLDELGLTEGDALLWGDLAGLLVLSLSFRDFGF